jgi:lysozyme family protein
MKNNWAKSYALLLVHEGGYVNHPKDPGGMTNLGVTKRAWEAYTGHPATEQDMRSLTPAKVEAFYRTRYWDAVKADDLPSGLDHCLFDTCVNSGPSRAVMLLQEVLGTVADGKIGPHTMDLTLKLGAHGDHLISYYCANRLNFLKSLPTWGTFEGGWKKRVLALEAEAKALSKGAVA